MYRIALIVMLTFLLAGCSLWPAPPAATPLPSGLPTASASLPDTSVEEATAPAETSAAVDPSQAESPAPTAEAAAGEPAASLPEIQEYPVPPGSHPHDVAPAPDGSVWYTAQGSGELGRLDPQTGETRHIPLGSGSAPHGVIVGPDGAPWVTDSVLNAIVRVDPETETAQVFPLPEGRGNANLNTAAFDGAGILWFTGQRGVYGRLDPASGEIEVFDAPRGPGAYGITGLPDGSIYFASLASSYIGRIDTQTGEAFPLDPPTPGQGARRVWADSQGRVWVSEWNAGQVGMYDPAADAWQEWKLPGDQPRAYAVYVDDRDIVWLSDFGANALVSFDPQQETFTTYPLPSPNANVRQILGRPGEVWGAESGADKLVVVRTAASQPPPAPEQTSPPAAADELSQPPDCTSPAPLTPAMTEGPYYKADSPERTSLLEEGIPGTRLILTGYVLTSDCQPIANAWLDFWQTDGNGEYDNTGYKMRGHQFTDEAGRFTLETVVPGLYPGRTAHIHVKVQAPGGPVLTTQLFVPGERGNESDRIFSPALVMDMQEAEGAKLAAFTFILDAR